MIANASTQISRRSFLGMAGTVAAAAGAVAAGATSAIAEPLDYTFAETVAWDAEYDVVVMGIGFAGLAAAMSAADEGARVLVAEKLPDGAAGGNSRVCGQMFFYGNGDVEGVRTYMAALADGHDIPEDLLDVYAQGYANSLQLLSEKFGVDAADCRDCAEVDKYGPLIASMSPEYPELPGAENMRLYASHDGISDSYLYDMMRERLAGEYADRVDVWFGSPVVGLVQDPASRTVLGAAVEHDGAPINVRALGGVVMACGGFENNRQMMADFTKLVGHACLGSLGNTGDGHILAQQAGARLWHMASFEGGFGPASLSYNVADDENALQFSAMVLTPAMKGAALLVGNEGRRWCNEGQIPRHGKISAGNGQWVNPIYPDAVYAVYDQAQMDLISENGVLHPLHSDDCIACADATEAAAVIGCDAQVLLATIADFNAYVEMGRDHAFGRNVETMRAFEGDALYLLPLRPALLNTQGGPQRDAQMQIVAVDGTPIPHLYGTGEFGGITSFMYNGGMNVGECFISGDIAGRNAAAGVADQLAPIDVPQAV